MPWRTGGPAPSSVDDELGRATSFMTQNRPSRWWRTSGELLDGPTTKPSASRSCTSPRDVYALHDDRLHAFAVRARLEKDVERQPPPMGRRAGPGNRQRGQAAQDPALRSSSVFRGESGKRRAAQSGPWALDSWTWATQRQLERASCSDPAITNDRRVCVDGGRRMYVYFAARIKKIVAAMKASAGQACTPSFSIPSLGVRRNRLHHSIFAMTPRSSNRPPPSACWASCRSSHLSDATGCSRTSCLLRLRIEDHPGQRAGRRHPHLTHCSSRCCTPTTRSSGPFSRLPVWEGPVDRRLDPASVHHGIRWLHLPTGLQLPPSFLPRRLGSAPMRKPTTMSAPSWTTVPARGLLVPIGTSWKRAPPSPSSGAGTRIALRIHRRPPAADGTFGSIEDLDHGRRHRGHRFSAELRGLLDAARGHTSHGDAIRLGWQLRMTLNLSFLPGCSGRIGHGSEFATLSGMKDTDWDLGNALPNIPFRSDLSPEVPLVIGDLLDISLHRWHAHRAAFLDAVLAGWRV